MPENTIGPYQLLGQLGAGGMGEVHKALDTRVGRHVALKRFSTRRRRIPTAAGASAAAAVAGAAVPVSVIVDAGSA